MRSAHRHHLYLRGKHCEVLRSLSHALFSVSHGEREVNPASPLPAIHRTAHMAAHMPDDRSPFRCSRCELNYVLPHILLFASFQRVVRVEGGGISSVANFFFFFLCTSLHLTSLRLCDCEVIPLRNRQTLLSLLCSKRSLLLFCFDLFVKKKIHLKR